MVLEESAAEQRQAQEGQHVEADAGGQRTPLDAESSSDAYNVRQSRDAQPCLTSSQVKVYEL